MNISEPVFYRQPISSWPEEERPRERLMDIGSFRLSDAELLAILIRTGSGKSTAVDLARELVSRSGGLPHLATMDFRQIYGMNIKGIGKTKAVTIAAAMQLAWRVKDKKESEPDFIIKSSDQAAKIIGSRMKNLKKEVFCVLLLASNNKVIKDVVLTEGVLNASLITPREVFREALVNMAGSVILVHNHPSGNKTPSRDDIRITEQMTKVGKAMNIPVLDHIIIAGDDYTSFADEGLID